MTLRLHGDARPLRADAKRWRCPPIRAGPRKGNRTIQAVPMLLDLLATVPSYLISALPHCFRTLHPCPTHLSVWV